MADSGSGGNQFGSEMKSTVLDVAKDVKDAVANRLLGNNSKYYDAAIIGDSKKYGIQTTYGLSSWQEW